MRVKTRISYFLVGALATQLMLGCQAGEKEDLSQVRKVNVPSAMEHPPTLVGKWKEAKGKQTVLLNADGSCEIVSQISIGADVTRGASQAFAQKIPSKWGIKDKTFYFYEVKDSPPLSYDWVMAGDKLILNTNGTKLTYSPIKDKPKA